MNSEYLEFPTYDEAIKSIEKLKNVSWPKFEEFVNLNEYIKEVEKIIFNEFDAIPDGLRLLNTEDFNLSLFRVREVKSINNIDLITEHSYPPVAFTSFGRCNFPKNPVFYCSNDPMTALMEVIRDTDFRNRKFCISKWEILPSKEKICFQNFLFTKLHEKNGFASMNDADISQLDKTFDYKLSPERKAGLIELMKFLHNSFINDKCYSLSAFLGYRSLYAKHELRTDILMYPSVQTQAKGVNLAIQPNFVDNRMVAKRFYFVDIEKYDPEIGHYTINFGRYAEVKKNVLMWHQPKKDDELFFKYHKADFSGFMETKMVAEK